MMFAYCCFCLGFRRICCRSVTVDIWLTSLRNSKTTGDEFNENKNIANKSYSAFCRNNSESGITSFFLYE